MDIVRLQSPRFAVPEGPWAMARAVPELLRAVDRELCGWQVRAAAIPDAELRRQAEASLRLKRFHCDGGAVYALAAGPGRDATLRFVVALQTISDYLDNLSDRTLSGGASDLVQLHTAMREAILPPEGNADRLRFYLHHPEHRNDGGYLDALVSTCQAEVEALPASSREAFRQEAARLVSWYCQLQETKHLPQGREEAVRRLARALAPLGPDLEWWEMAAAAGSTLGVFALFAQAAAGPLDAAAARALRTAYFPHVTGLHILLDYWIDRAEDRHGGDLNFTFYYRDAAQAAHRLAALGRKALRAALALPNPGFHRTVVRGLPALYLSDPKVAGQGLQGLGWRVLGEAGPWTWLLYWAVRWFRNRGTLRPA